MHQTGPLLADLVDAALPQTQCTRCGFPDCRAYAQAIAREGCDINRCPPGGQEGVERLARITGRPASPLDADRGMEGPRLLAFIDEAHCIGCTLCIKACPVDCIVGAPKRMHTVIESACTGCELCVPACPVDCILLEVATPERSGWQAWSDAQAQRAREAYAARTARASSLQRRHDDGLLRKASAKLTEIAEASSSGVSVEELERKRTLVQAAIERAQRRQTVATPSPDGGPKPSTPP